MTIQLFNGDCLEVMDKLIADGIKVDAVITDPPYGTTACKWDSVIPFDKMWERLKKIKKNNAPIVLFCSQPFTSSLVMSNIKNYKHHWVWYKNRGTGFQVAKYRPLMQTEDIISFCENKINYYPQMVETDKTYKYKLASSSNGTNPLAYFHKGEKVTNKRYPTNILNFKKVAKPIHPTQKPVELLEYLIKTYTNQGDTVLDFCMGSGTTGVACKKLNRNFIGIELDKKYFDIAEKRINETTV